MVANIPVVWVDAARCRPVPHPPYAASVPRASKRATHGPQEKHGRPSLPDYFQPPGRPARCLRKAAPKLHEQEGARNAALRANDLN